jgi:hypothetical protein
MTHSGPIKGLSGFWQQLGSISDNKGFKNPLNPGIAGAIDQTGKSAAGFLHDFKGSPGRILFDNNQCIPLKVCGRPNAFKRQIPLVIKSAGIFKICGGSDPTVEPDLVSNGKIRDITDSRYAQRPADSVYLNIITKGSRLQMKSCTMIDFLWCVGDSPGDIPSMGIRVLKDMIGGQSGGDPGLDG